jgi:ribosomal protein S18 acetylase RimI-like enzyme
MGNSPITMRPYRGETDLQPIVDLLHACEAVDQLEQWTSVAELRLDFDAPSMDKARTGRLEGWIGILGTRRGFRRIGLARAMLLRGLQQLKAAGMDTAKIGVDAENPLGARQLYESVGFQKLHTRLMYVKDL